jgi:quinoprotein glucose dehydrogenase
MMALRTCAVIALAGFAIASVAGRLHSQARTSVGWTDYGGGPDSSKYVDLTQITPANVGTLRPAWTYPIGDNNVYQFNPIVAGSTMYVLAKNSSLVALDAVTGKEQWIHAGLRGITRRGINYWESADRSDRRLIFQINDYLQAIDAATGKSILTFGDKGLVDLRIGVGRDPALIGRIQSNTPGRIYKNLLLLGSAPGEGYLSAPGTLRAYDVVTGRLAWAFHTIPQPGEAGYETWPKDAWRYAGAANTWGEISVDAARGIAYFPTGSPTYDYYGADRVGSNLYANSLLALDADTGKRLWHFQMVHHDLWDYDVVSAPQLITVRHDGRTVDAVAQATKQGFLFVFDRVTGQPLWPIEERPIPKSDMPGERTWPTQPFPTKPLPFARQSMTEADLTPYYLSAPERAQWVDRLRRAKHGLFAPLSTEWETVAVPGANGGANWGNTAADPRNGLVYVISEELPSFYRLSDAPPGPGGGAAAAERGRGTYAQTCQTCHGVDRSGSANAPSLAGLSSRVQFEDFRQVVLSGRGHMPAFPSIEDAEMRALWQFINGGTPARPRADVASSTPEGPVVAVGGAPGGLEVRRGPQGGPRGGPYPDGVDAPPVRYYTDYGLGFPYIMKGPLSQITAYDLNTGNIVWQRAHGVDPIATGLGAKDWGVPRGGNRTGMIVTSTGLLFATSRDGKVRARDAKTGDVLWTGDLPRGTEALPAMYQVGGRQYLVVSASTNLNFGKVSRDAGPWTDADGPAPGPSAYLVFALPDPRVESTGR